MTGAVALTRRTQTRWLYVHHSVSPPETTPEQIRAWHRARGWAEIGYHVVIHRSPEGGWIASRGRDEGAVGAHVGVPGRRNNSDSVGVVVCGDYRHDAPDDGALRLLVVILEAWCRVYDLTPEAILGHRDAPGAATECPGGALHQLLPAVREAVARRLADPTAALWPPTPGVA